MQIHHHSCTRGFEHRLSSGRACSLPCIKDDILIDDTFITQFKRRHYFIHGVNAFPVRILGRSLFRSLKVLIKIETLEYLTSFTTAMRSLDFSLLEALVPPGMSKKNVTQISRCDFSDVPRLASLNHLVAAPAGVSPNGNVHSGKGYSQKKLN